MEKGSAQWFYEEKGEKSKQGLGESDIIKLIQEGRINYGTLLWRPGFQNWTAVEMTELKQYLIAPPPVSGTHVNNTLAWVIAFVPIIGAILEGFVSGLVYGYYRPNKFWYITLLLNIILCIYDEKRLKAAGYDVSKLKGWVWFVPVYLFQRARLLKQNLAYFIVWLVCFLLIVLGL